MPGCGMRGGGLGGIEVAGGVSAAFLFAVLRIQGAGWSCTTCWVLWVSSTFVNAIIVLRLVSRPRLMIREPDVMNLSMYCDTHALSDFA